MYVKGLTGSGLHGFKTCIIWESDCVCKGSNW